MIHETSSIERYREGKALVDKYDPACRKGVIATLLYGLLSLVIVGVFQASTWSFCSVLLIFIPFIPTTNASLRCDRGVRMMKSAEETWGSNEEEY